MFVLDIVSNWILPLFFLLVGGVITVAVFWTGRQGNSRDFF